MRGDLVEKTAADVCRELAARQDSGILAIEGPGGPGRVVFADGRIIAAVSPTPRARLGDRLVGAGELDPGDLANALQAQQEAGEGSRLGSLLVERGLVRRDAVRVFVQEQVLDALFEIIRWRYGAFTFSASDQGNTQGVPLMLAVDDALVEVARRQQEWDELSRVIPDLEAVPSFRSGAASASASLEPDEFAVLASVDGVRSVRALAADLGYGEFEAARIVYGLTLLGIVDVRLPEDEIGAALEDALGGAFMDPPGEPVGEEPPLPDEAIADALEEGPEEPTPDAATASEATPEGPQPEDEPDVWVAPSADPGGSVAEHDQPVEADQAGPADQPGDESHPVQADRDSQESLDDHAGQSVEAAHRVEPAELDVPAAQDEPADPVGPDAQDEPGPVEPTPHDEPAETLEPAPHDEPAETLEPSQPVEPAADADGDPAVGTDPDTEFEFEVESAPPAPPARPSQRGPGADRPAPPEPSPAVPDPAPEPTAAQAQPRPTRGGATSFAKLYSDLEQDPPAAAKATPPPPPDTQAPAEPDPAADAAASTTPADSDQGSARPPRQRGDDNDVSEFLRELSRLSLDPPDEAGSATPKQPPSPPRPSPSSGSDSNGGSKKKRRGLFGRG